ncbi:MAG TPA: Ig-like domain-containing protein [Terriglobales bacterium]|nr:Ig-like domain-containing protein [Terriglobales bacterium]
MKCARSKKLLLFHFLLLLTFALAGCAGGGGGTGPSRGISQPGVPNISNVSTTNVAITTATVTWTTDTATTSQVEFGTSASYGSSSPADNALVTSHSVSLSGLTAGALYHYRVRSKDSGGSEAVSPDATFQTVLNVDTTPPTVSVVAPGNGTTVNGTISLSSQASDNSGIKSVRFLIDGNPFGATLTTLPYDVSWDTTTVANGTHTISATATDYAGNATNAAVVTVTVQNNLSGGGDTSPPNVIITSPVGGSTVAGTLNMIATAADNTGVIGVQFLLDGTNFGSEVTSPPYTKSWNTTLNTNGAHRVEARARDAAGNVGSAVVQVAVDNTVPPGPDTTKPTVQIVAPGNGANVTGTIMVTALATDNIGVASVQFQVDGTNSGAAVTTSPYNFVLDTTKLPNGSHTIGAIAKDASNNSGTTSISVNVANGVVLDTTPPAIQITAPASGASLTGTVTISATASDNVAVGGVQFKVDGANVGSEVTASPFQTSLNTASLTNGNHTISATARDTSNNTTSVNVSVTVSNTTTNDTTPPTVQVTSPSAGATLTGTTTLSAAASDNVAIAGVQFDVDGTNIGSEVTTAPYQVSLNTGTITNASHTIRATARDTSNNTATANVSVTVSNSSPGSDLFQTQCLNDPNIVRCYGFDGPIPQGTDASVGPVVSSTGGVYQATFDSTRATSGAGSLKFRIPSSANANTSGAFHVDFSDDPYPIQFGPTSPAGNEFYIQWRQYMPTEMITMKPYLGGGFKHAIINMGNARSGTEVNTPYTCADMEITIQRYYHQPFLNVYHSCGKKDNTYQPLQPNAGSYDYLLQNAIGCRFTDGIGCFDYAADQWMTFQIHVKTGEDYVNDRNYRHDSTFELWLAEEGKPSQLVISMTDYDFLQHDLSGNWPYPATWWTTNGLVPRYGKIWFLPYETGRCPATFNINSISRSNGTVTVTSASHATQNGYCLSIGDSITIAGVSDSTFNGTFNVTSVDSDTVITYSQSGANSVSGSGTMTGAKLVMPDTATWYDSLVVSKRRLPDPGVQVPNAPDSLMVTNDGTKNTLTWRDNSDVYGSTAATGFVIERCQGYTNLNCYYDQTKFAVVGTVGTVNSWSDPNGSASIAYTYRVKATNGSGASAYSNAAMNVPGAVGNVTAVANSSSQVTVSWTQTPPANQISYTVERCTGGYLACDMTASNYVVLSSTVPANSSTFVDNTVAGGTTYTYRVLSVGKAGSYKSWGEKYYYNTSYGGASLKSQVTTP